MKKRQAWLFFVNMLMVFICLVFLGGMFFALSPIFSSAAEASNNDTVGLMIKVVLALPLPMIILTLIFIIFMSASFFMNKQA